MMPFEYEWETQTLVHRVPVGIGRDEIDSFTLVQHVSIANFIYSILCNLISVLSAYMALYFGLFG